MTVIVVAPPAAPGLAAPVLADALSRLRQDLFDQAGASPLRWQDADLQRAVDRALDQYSFVAPRTSSTVIAAAARQRLYPAAGTALTAGSPWWVTEVEYPVGQWPRVYVPFTERAQPRLGQPAAPTLAAAAGALAGTYGYAATFLGIAGESAISPTASIALAGQGCLAALPTGPAGYTTGRRLYRTAAGGTALLLAATIADNTTSSYLDTAADGALGGPAPVGDTTAGQPLVELGLVDGDLPQVGTTDSLEIGYASKHIWDEGGTSLPEQHHDIVLLGAAAYACLAYQVPTNDAFEFQDGGLRDRISEVKTPEHWLAAGSALLAQFKARLEEVRRQRDAGSAAIAQWGSVPSRWSWL